MPAKKLGVYFGLQSVSLVEQQGRRITNHSHFALPSAPVEQKTSLTLEERASSSTGIDEVKVIAKLQEELRTSRIEAKEVVLGLSEKDIFVRFFDLPYIPREEWDSAIYFEVKKYLPFRPEDLVFDYQAQANRATNKIDILFVAAKKETVEAYISIMEQTGLKVTTIEPAPFSLLRVLKLSNQLEEKKISAVVDAGPEESTITIVERGLPYFSREIKVAIPQAQASSPAKPLLEGLAKEPGAPQAPNEALLAKFTNEIRISLDYYRRQVSAKEKEVEKIVFLGTDVFKDWVEFANRELDIPVIPANLEKAIEPGIQFNSAIVKAFGASLKDAVPFGVRLNLATKKQLALPAEKVRAISEEAITLSAITQARVIKVGAGFALAIMAITYIMSIPKVIAAQKELRDVMANRPQTRLGFAALPKKDLDGVFADYKRKVETLDRLIKNKAFLTLKLDVLPRVVPDGVWLTQMNFQESDEGRQTITMQGTASLGDEKKEFDAVNKLLMGIKESKAFKDTFKEIELVSANREQLQTRFEITCR